MVMPTGLSPSGRGYAEKRRGEEILTLCVPCTTVVCCVCGRVRGCGVCECICAVRGAAY